MGERLQSSAEQMNQRMEERLQLFTHDVEQHLQTFNAQVNQNLDELRLCQKKLQASLQEYTPLDLHKQTYSAFQKMQFQGGKRKDGEEEVMDNDSIDKINASYKELDAQITATRKRQDELGESERASHHRELRELRMSLAKQTEEFASRERRLGELTLENVTRNRAMVSSHEELMCSHFQLERGLKHGSEEFDEHLETNQEKIAALTEEFSQGQQHVEADRASCRGEFGAQLDTKIEESPSREHMVQEDATLAQCSLDVNILGVEARLGKQIDFVQRENRERMSQFEERLSKAVDAVSTSFMKQLECSHSRLQEVFQHKNEEFDARLDAFSQNLATESMECNSRIDEHQAWNVELASACGRIDSIVKTLETSVEKLAGTCGGQLGALLQEERQVRQAVLQAEAASRTRELQEISRTVKEVTQLTNQMNHERCTRIEALVHHLEDEGPTEDYLEEPRARHSKLSSVLLNTF